MPRYRVLLSRPNAAFVDLLIDAEDEAQARRLACDMAWHDLDDGATLPVSIALYEEIGGPDGTSEGPGTSRLIMQTDMAEPGARGPDGPEQDEDWLRDADASAQEAGAQETGAQETSAQKTSAQKTGALTTQPETDAAGDNVVSLDAFRRRKKAQQD